MIKNLGIYLYNVQTPLSPIHIVHCIHACIIIKLSLIHEKEAIIVVVVVVDIACVSP